MSQLYRGESLIISNLEVARTHRERFLGLMGRRTLSEDQALWIPQCRSVHTFFMRFPIECIFLDENLRVIKWDSPVAAWRISSCWKNILNANISVLECSIGITEKFQIQRGDYFCVRN